MSWIDEASQRNVAEVAQQLGIELRRHTGHYSCKCLKCGEERRHKKRRDPRGAVRMPFARPDYWHCIQCEVWGDAIDLVACRLFGAPYRDLHDGQRAEVRGWFLLDPNPAPKTPRWKRQKPANVAWENADAAYPPIREVEALWEASRPVSGDAQALGYLAYRGIAWEPLEEHDCVRVLPLDYPCPEWAHLGHKNPRPWTRTGHRLIIPLYDWHGNPRSVIARSVERAPALKSVGALGQRRGLVMAGTYGRQMLASGNHPALHRMEHFRLHVYEGEISFLRGIANGADDVLVERFEPAAYRGAIGIFSGSFTRDIASRVPTGSVVHLRTDDDEQGRKYAQQIRMMLADRVKYVEEFEPDDSPANALESEEGEGVA